MKLGPRYKICRRLGPGVFDKCQTNRYSVSEARHAKSARRGRPNTSNFARQLLEKQKIRFAYGIQERQLRRYIEEASRRVAGKAPNTRVLELLEMRLDNVVYRSGFATSRRQARQLVAHGHFTVNGKRLTVPSYQVAQGDVIAVRETSKQRSFFENLKERMENAQPPAWMTVDAKAFLITVTGVPNTETTESLADLNAVIEFVSR